MLMPMLPSNKSMKTTVIGILGSRLDHQGLGKRRHSRWRPSVGILMHPDFPVDEFVLIHHADEAELAGITLRDMRTSHPPPTLPRI